MKNDQKLTDLRNAFLSALTYDVIFNYTQRGMIEDKDAIKLDIADRYNDQFDTLELSTDELDEVIQNALDEISEISYVYADYEKVPVWDMLDSLHSHVLNAIEKTGIENAVDLIDKVASSPMLNPNK